MPSEDVYRDQGQPRSDGQSAEGTRPRESDQQAERCECKNGRTGVPLQLHDRRHGEQANEQPVGRDRSASRDEDRVESLTFRSELIEVDRRGHRQQRQQNSCVLVAVAT